MYPYLLYIAVDVLATRIFVTRGLDMMPETDIADIAGSHGCFNIKC
jgi:hypothetical protein